MQLYLAQKTTTGMSETQRITKPLIFIQRITAVVASNTPKKKMLVGGLIPSEKY